MAFSLDDREKLILLKTAREAIEARLRGREGDYPEPTETLKAKCGAFVTLHKGKKLRGCIGQIYGRNQLFPTIKSMAVSSAFQDPRFPPLSPAELDEISIEISVLTPLERIDSIDEIELGKHGIYMKRGFNSGLLLPQVAEEQGWDKETFLSHTCLKAGMSGDCYKKSDIEIYIFSAIIFKEEDYEHN